MGRFKWAVQPSIMETSVQQECQRANNSDQTDSDGNIEGNYKFKERELKKSSSPFPTMKYNVYRPNISPSKTVNITPGQGQVPVYFTSKPDWEALVFAKNCSIGRNYFIEGRETALISSVCMPDWHAVMMDLLLILNTYFMH